MVSWQADPPDRCGDGRKPVLLSCLAEAYLRPYEAVKLAVPRSLLPNPLFSTNE